MRSLALAVVCAAAGLHAADPAPVAFRSFEYTGRDPVFAEPLPQGSFQNPILAGFYSDPSICRVGDDYYLINSTFSYYPGIPVFHSKDLVNWTQIGNVIHRPSQLPYDGLGVSRAIFAPAISYHNGTYYVVCTMVDAGGNFLVTAKNPAGPWSDPIWYDFEGIDPSLFFDEDGRAWLVNNGAPDEKPRYEGHRAIWIQEFDPKTNQLIGERKVIVNGGVDISKKPIWIEGPHLYKREGWYYLCCAEGGTSEGHSQVILRSRAVTGPYVPWEGNPILTQRDLDGKAAPAVTSTGHADLVIGPDGQWWSVFLACRPYGPNYYNTGRETFLLPVEWTDDGWPRILPPGVRVPYQVPAPKLAGSEKPRKAPLPLTGNFTLREEFTGPELGGHWMMLRTPKSKWYTMGAQGGGLAITPRADPLSGTGNPSWLGRRVQHLHFDAITELVPPTGAGVSAGVAVFQGEKHHYYLGVRQMGEQRTLFLEQANGKPPVVLATKPLPAGEGVLKLKVVSDGPTISFYAARGSGPFEAVLENADGKILSTRVAGGFVGAMIGPHARLE